MEDKNEILNMENTTNNSNTLKLENKRLKSATKFLIFFSVAVIVITGVLTFYVYEQLNKMTVTLLQSSEVIKVVAEENASYRNYVCYSIIEDNGLESVESCKVLGRKSEVGDKTKVKELKKIKINPNNPILKIEHSKGNSYYELSTKSLEFKIKEISEEKAKKLTDGN